MQPLAIIFPAIAMFFLTLGMILWLGFNRQRAIRRRDVSIKYFRTYNEGTQPDRLHLLGRHVQNHFEVPPLFYLGVLFVYVTDFVTTTAVACAWLFVLARCLHSYIHLGSNNVSVRFFTFGFGLLCLAGVWLSLLVTLL